MNIKYGVIGLLLIVIGIIILLKQIRKKAASTNIFDRFLSFARAILAGEYISLALISICVGILFLCTSFGVFEKN